MPIGSQDNELELRPGDEYMPRVFLVGAGPGNPGLLTLRAVECLASAVEALKRLSLRN